MLDLLNKLTTAHLSGAGIVAVRTHQRDVVEDLILRLFSINCSRVSSILKNYKESNPAYSHAYDGTLTTSLNYWRSKHWERLELNTEVIDGHQKLMSEYTGNPYVRMFKSVKSTSTPISDIHNHLCASLEELKPDQADLSKSSSTSLNIPNRAGAATKTTNSSIVNMGDDSVYVIPYVDEFKVNPSSLVCLEDYLVKVGLLSHPDCKQRTQDMREYVNRKFAYKTIILLLNPDDELPLNVTKHIQIFDDPLPNLKLREDYIKSIVTSNYEEAKNIKNSKSKDIKFIQANFNNLNISEVSHRLASVLGGLTLKQIKSIYVTILKDIKHSEDNHKVNDLESLYKACSDAKIALVNTCPALEYIQPVSMDDVAGLDGIKKFLELRKLAFTQEAKDFGVTRPKGIFLAGIPGTGKSLTAKACGSFLGRPVIKLCLASVYGGLVGESERKMREALSVLKALAPAVVFVDEIDKSVSLRSGGGDSGTSQRVLGSLLTFMQDCEEDLFFVLSANRVDNLPAELTRKGRVDECFGLTYPTPKEIRQCISIHLKKRNRRVDELIKDDREEIVKALKRFVPAEIEAIVNEAILNRFHKHKTIEGESSILSKEDFMEIIESTKKIADTSKDQLEQIEKWVKESAREA